MAKAKAHKWVFKARFRRGAFGWKSRPAIERVKQAVSEIGKVARGDPVLAAEGAVLFLEKLSPAVENVDGSSGSMGNAVNNAVATLVPLIAAAPADAETRAGWLDRLWEAYEQDGMCYLEELGECWGELCGSVELASRWADLLIGTTRFTWTPDPTTFRYFRGAVNCLSALLAAGRHEELLELLEMEPNGLWHHRKFGVRALAAMGRVDEALRLAEQRTGQGDSPWDMARTCEEILLAAERTNEAYRRYGLLAAQSGTYLAWFRKVARRYPHKQPAEILADLLELTPGEEGKWFAAAKDAKLFDEAIDIANRSPCSPQTLTRAARDFAEERPTFALEAGLAALRWLVEGYGYEVTGLDVDNAFSHTLKAAERAGRADEARRRIRDLVAAVTSEQPFVAQMIRRRLESA